MLVKEKNKQPSETESILGIFRFFNGVAFFEAYLDESGTHADSLLTTVAGAISKESSWKSIVPQWQSVLNKFEVSAFHATDLNCFGGEYRGWNESKRREFFTLIFKIMNSEPLIPIGTTVENSVFKKVMIDFPEFPTNSYQFCCEWCLMEMAAVAKKHKHMEPVAVVFEAGQKTNSLGLQLLQQGFNFGELRAKYKIEGFSFYSKKSMIPLQIADLIVYELNHGHTIIEQHGSRPLRFPLQQLVENHGWPKGGTIHEESIRRHFTHQREFAKRHNEENKS